MTQVRIVVDDRVLGDVEVGQELPAGSFSPDQHRELIRQLLSEATTKINNAYGLATTREDPNT